MSDAVITIKGLDKLIGKLVSMEQLNAVKAALSGAADHVKGKIARYPSATSANAPGAYPKRWYERGFGSRWALAGGGVGGRKTSENLGRKWTSVASLSGWQWTIGNNVSYGPFVHGEKEQARAMANIGWKRVDEVAAQEAEYVNKVVHQAIEVELNK